MVSVNRIKNRRSGFVVHDWIMDSGAFTQLNLHSGYTEPVSVYADQVKRWRDNGNMLIAVAQDYMCEPFMLKKTGKTTADHQALTIDRYDQLIPLVDGAPIMPVLQGYDPSEYARHVADYGDRLVPRAWVGVGSVCKRNGDPAAIKQVLYAIKDVRPDLRLHGFGVKLTSLRDPIVCSLLHSADSMAWSFAARREGKDANHWQEARNFVDKIEGIPEAETMQYDLWGR